MKIAAVFFALLSFVSLFLPYRVNILEQPLIIAGGTVKIIETKMSTVDGFHLYLPALSIIFAVLTVLFIFKQSYRPRYAILIASVNVLLVGIIYLWIHYGMLTFIDGFYYRKIGVGFVVGFFTNMAMLTLSFINLRGKYHVKPDNELLDSI